jgi:peptidoglycan/xylan/chitin deacetylase (PgdA/CDA1 family)
MTKYCIFSNDVETTSIWLNKLSDETGWKVYREGMPLLLDIYEKHGIKSTFFFTGYIAKLIPDIIKMIQNRGHEVASHGLSHLKENGFDVMPFAKQKIHLLESKKILEDISGEEVISFRAPALRVNNDTASALIETGYKIDSSVASQRFDMFMSFGGLKKLNWITAHRLPYHTSEKSIFKKGDSPLVEVPLSALIIPYIGTTMRIFPNITNIQKRILALESNFFEKPIVFDIHPNELIDESHIIRSIENRSSNPVSYFLQDFLRAKLKSKNLGIAAIPLFENQIKYFRDKNFEFVTLKTYCEETKLI